MSNPLVGNPLTEREHYADAARRIIDALIPHFSPGSARVDLGLRGTTFSADSAELEGFARPLWAIAALGAGGHSFDHWDTYRAGLTAGPDPDHREYWGAYDSLDQRMVEQAAIAYALATVPDELWHPLSDRTRTQLVEWLNLVNTVEPFRNNWQWFRVLVNVALARLGADVARDANDSAFEIIDGLSTDDGWYRDGPPGTCDLYVGNAFHYYGLLYSTLAADEHAARFRRRAESFAHDWVRWFDAGGDAVPFGRSLTYRFALGGYWAALAAADVEALPWGQLRGLLGRHLRAWSHRPIWNTDGTLSVGYAYPNDAVGEEYISNASPYWAMKSFAALSAPADHPFWTEPETPSDTDRPPSLQPTPGVIVTDDADSVVVLSARHNGGIYRQGAARYAKFAYSSRFGPSLAADVHSPHQVAPDSMLALSEGHGPWRVRTTTSDWGVSDDRSLWAEWSPWPDVSIRTVLRPATTGHLRLHSIHTERRLSSVEGGFAIGFGGSGALRPAVTQDVDLRRAVVEVDARMSGVAELTDVRRASVIAPVPGTNLMAPRTLLPTLETTLEPGHHLLAGWFGCAHPPAVDATVVEELLAIAL